ncbi:SAVED domain-containing protein [Catenibacterium mitsuokai]|uniref:SAVED domain-containing protein n=1 Tax=Catenibacterium mitsuokai TaxID=100886 RepID=UPI003F895CE0
MAEKKSNRGKGPSLTTKMILFAKSGGRCQFEGCNKYLLRDDITSEELNDANIAHIVASSSNGPRGACNSHELSDDINNLMLLCKTHHKLVDDNPEEYTVERLTEMKLSQERKVKELLDAMQYTEALIVMLESPIKKEQTVKIDSKQAVHALRTTAHNPFDHYETHIRFSSNSNYKDRQYWREAENHLNREIDNLINGLLQENPKLTIAIFSIAPIPLIMKLGYKLGDKRKILVFQKYREPDTWEWLSNSQTNSFSYEMIKRGNGTKVAVIVSVTSEIDLSRVMAIDAFDTIYHLKAENCGVNAIKSKEDLKFFWEQYQKLLDNIKNNDHVEDVSLFPAVPVSAAYEMGRRYMPHAYPKIRVYDECDGFFETITIGD